MEPNPDDGFSQYVKQVRSELRRRAFLLCGDWFEADDLTQKTLVKMFLLWPQLDNREELAGYLRSWSAPTSAVARSPGRPVVTGGPR
ncbi:RNA polymerase sigma factor [Actinomadura sp. 9N215]|uniref:RNA polymerase sigma factor n=1 Tax=Actinomadura sp. 9N215 TaxID=3375150 RepID=UPI003788B979